MTEIRVEVTHPLVFTPIKDGVQSGTPMIVENLVSTFRNKPTNRNKSGRMVQEPRS